MATFAFNQPVTLKTDKDFLGYAWGQVIGDGDGIERVMISVKKPSKTKLHVDGNYAFPADNVVPVEEHKARAKEKIS